MAVFIVLTVITRPTARTRSLHLRLGRPQDLIGHTVRLDLVGIARLVDRKLRL